MSQTMTMTTTTTSATTKTTKAAAGPLLDAAGEEDLAPELEERSQFATAAALIKEPVPVCGTN
jgi:hypothetical protein